jgi:hypothetical protein
VWEEEDKAKKVEEDERETDARRTPDKGNTTRVTRRRTAR